MDYNNAADILPPQLLSRIQEYCTGMLWVPKVERNYISDRNKKIFRLKKSGLSNTRIACEMGLSERQVRRVLAADKSRADMEI